MVLLRLQVWANQVRFIKDALKMVKGAKTFLDAYGFNIWQHRNFKRELDRLTSMVAY